MVVAPEVPLILSPRWSFRHAIVIPSGMLAGVTFGRSGSFPHHE
jgi:hypothetical protein